AWGPNVHAIPTSAVDISVRIALDSVWYTDVGECEQSSVQQYRLSVALFYVESISVLLVREL
ncbi:SMP-30/Gluconolaconase/LRE-like region, partial [Colletotrichum scovillei]